MFTTDLNFLNGHLFVSIDSNDWLLDTGAPSSFGDIQEFQIADRDFTISNDLAGLTASLLSGHVDHNTVGLIGADILNTFSILFDVANKKISFSLDKVELDGDTLEINEVMGIPIVTALIGGEEKQMFFDTGAQISYLQNQSLNEYPSAGVMDDFYPGIGEFQTETYMVDALLGTQQLTLRCGSLPELLGMTLMMAGSEGIIGNEVMVDRVVGYFPKQKQLVFGPALNKSKTNQFEVLCELASSEHWCWNLACTTCGHMHFRYAFVELANGKSPNDINWIVHNKRHDYSSIGELPRSYSIEQKEEVIKICLQADIKAVAKNSSFPDWLGYLGLVLSHTYRDSPSYKALSATWAVQLKQLVYPKTEISSRLKDLSEGQGLLSLNDLEQCEYNIDNRALR